MKPVDPKDRSTGINFASAREWLKGLPERRLDSDWVAVDMEGHVAFFAGNEVGPIPNDADVERVGEVHEALARARRATQSVAEMPEGYRRPADHANEPIFDVPVTPLGGPAHEGPADGYPLLVSPGRGAERRGRSRRPRVDRPARRLACEARRLVRGRRGAPAARPPAVPPLDHQRDETMAFAISAKPAPRLEGAIHRGGTLSILA